LLAGLATKIGAPYPVVLVLGGLVMGALPGIPSPHLAPDLVLVLFLPLLVYSAAFNSSIDDLRANAGPIVRLAVGLVLITVGVVALVVHFAAGLPWGVAFVLGGVVGPTDPVAASTVIRRLGAPERIVTILEGESLVNDGTGIAAYTVAVATVTTGAFSWSSAVTTFALAVFAGIAIGLAVGWLAVRARRLIDDPHVEVALSLLTPFVAYISADQLGGSGVLAAVAAGLYTGEQATSFTSVGSRLQLSSFWGLLEFLLNALLFLLIGEQLPHVLAAIPGGLSATLVGQGLLAAAAVLTIRMAWMFSVPAVSRALKRGREATPSRATVGARVVLGWSGLRGAVSLALVLGLPLTVSTGQAFPHRSELVFLGYVVVVTTLVGPGLTVGPLARRLGLLQRRDNDRQEARVRAMLLHTALGRIEDLAQDGSVSEETADRMRSVYQTRLDRVTARLEGNEERAAAGSEAARVRRAVIAAERDRLTRMRREHQFPTQLLDEIERDLDLEELRTR
jgi:CPA1 family monovalent cation:H+ antiporter